MATKIMEWVCITAFAAANAQVTINSDQDIVLARQKGRALATGIGFASGDATLIATAISELARNIVSYARKGQIILRMVNDCLLYTSPSPRDLSTSRMPSSA